jgi:hypothetical protein
LFVGLDLIMNQIVKIFYMPVENVEEYAYGQGTVIIIPIRRDHYTAGRFQGVEIFRQRLSQGSQHVMPVSVSRRSDNAPVNFSALITERVAERRLRNHPEKIAIHAYCAFTLCTE